MFNLPGISIPQPKSRYIRTTWMLSADEMELGLPDLSKIRLFSRREASELAELMRKRNVFIRNAGEYDFYLQRVDGLANYTVIEVSFDGHPKEASNKVGKVADLLEMLAILSASLALRRDELQRKLGISSNPRSEADFSWEPTLQSFSSKLRPARFAPGIKIDKRFCNRFSRCKFEKLYEYCLTGSSMAKRVLLLFLSNENSTI